MYTLRIVYATLVNSHRAVCHLAESKPANSRVNSEHLSYLIDLLTRVGRVSLLERMFLS